MQLRPIDCQQYCKVFSAGIIVFLTTVAEIIGHSCTKNRQKCTNIKTQPNPQTLYKKNSNYD